jgi:hypothetical protein
MIRESDPEPDMYRWYISHISRLLTEQALLAKTAREQFRGTDKEAYYVGELHAYHRVISLIKQEAEVWHIMLEDSPLNDIEPDWELI